jgi:hypothetical protein
MKWFERIAQGRKLSALGQRFERGALKVGTRCWASSRKTLHAQPENSRRPPLTRHIVLVLVVPTSLRTARIAHSTKSYVGQAVLVLESVCTQLSRRNRSYCLGTTMATPPNTLRGLAKFLMPETSNQMIVYHAHGLHKRVTGCWPEKVESVCFQSLGEFPRLFALRRDVGA